MVKQKASLRTGFFFAFLAPGFGPARKTVVPSQGEGMEGKGAVVKAARRCLV